MPTIDLAPLGTIVITAITGGVIGYAAHWLQLRHQRKWQKIDEVHKRAIQFVEGLRTNVLNLISYLNMLERGLLKGDESAKELSKISAGLNQLPIDLSGASMLHDAELLELYIEIEKKFEKVVKVFLTAQSLTDIKDIPWGVVHETLGEIVAIMYRIDERFEQLKSRIW